MFSEYTLKVKRNKTNLSALSIFTRLDLEENVLFKTLFFKTLFTKPVKMPSASKLMSQVVYVRYKSRRCLKALRLNVSSILDSMELFRIHVQRPLRCFTKCYTSKLFIHRDRRLIYKLSMFLIKFSKHFIFFWK